MAHDWCNLQVLELFELFTKFGVFKIGIIISSSKISWAIKYLFKYLVLLSTTTKNFHETIAESLWTEWVSHTSHDIHDKGRWKKSRLTLAFFFFFKVEERAMTKLWFQSKCCYSWKLWWPLVLMFLLPGSEFLPMMKKIVEIMFLLLKHQDQCLVTMSYKTLNIALKVSKFTRME